MKVILQQNIQKVGKVGDVVETSDGYFRNYLQPRNLAILATTGTLKKREEDLETIRKKAAATHQKFIELSEKITAIGSIRLEAKAGEGGKLYGKVTSKEIAQHLSRELDYAIEKKDIRGAEEINALGTYKVIVKLAADVQSELNIEVALEGSPIVAKKAVGKESSAKETSAEEASQNSDL
jgi:large subunit ribosomal protein L9